MPTVSVVFGKSIKPAKFYHKGKRISVDTAFGMYNKKVGFVMDGKPLRFPSHFGAKTTKDTSHWDKLPQELKSKIYTLRPAHPNADSIKQGRRHMEEYLELLNQLERGMAETRDVPEDTLQDLQVFYDNHMEKKRIKSFGNPTFDNIVRKKMYDIAYSFPDVIREYTQYDGDFHDVPFLSMGRNEETLQEFGDLAMSVIMNGYEPGMWKGLGTQSWHDEYFSDVHGDGTEVYDRDLVRERLMPFDWDDSDDSDY
jgi:hypothetical protein